MRFFNFVLIFSLAGITSARAQTKLAEFPRALQFFSELTPNLCPFNKMSIQILESPMVTGLGDAHRHGSGNNYLIRLGSNLSALHREIVVIHELAHICRDFYFKNDPLWFSEGLAKLIEYQFTRVWPQNFELSLAQGNEIFLAQNEEDFRVRTLKHQSFASPGYSSSFLFFIYLYNRFGWQDFIRTLLQERSTGWAAIESTLQALKVRKGLLVPDSFLSRESLWTHFGLALIYNNPGAASFGLLQLDRNYQNVWRPGALIPAGPERAWSLRIYNKFEDIPSCDGGCRLFLARRQKNQHEPLVEEFDPTRVEASSERGLWLLIKYDGN